VRRQGFLQHFETPLHLAFHGAGLDRGQPVDCLNEEIAGLHVFHGAVQIGLAHRGAAPVRGNSQNQEQDDRNGGELAPDNNHQSHIETHKWEISQDEARRAAVPFSVGGQRLDAIKVPAGGFNFQERGRRGHGPLENFVMGAPGEDCRRPTHNMVSGDSEDGFRHHRKHDHDNEQSEGFHRLAWNDAVIDLHDRQGHEERKKVNED